jgi:hypothetical protein
VWKVIAKVVKQDMTKVSLPVIVSEPLNALQRSAEIMSNWKIVQELLNTINEDQASQDPSKASCKRLALCGMMQIAHFIGQRNRIKKPFNPILGETFELVNDRFRFMAEQVSHHPPITAFVAETEGFRLETYS